MPGLLTKILRRVHQGEDPKKVVAEFKDALPAGLLDADPDDDKDDGGDQHIHVHLGGSSDPADPGKLDPDDDGDLDDPDDLVSAISELLQPITARLDAIEAKINGDDEHEVELESKNEDGTVDARRFTLRRGSKLKTRDEDTEPERTPEMMGETDLPGIMDLNARKTTDSVVMEPTWQQTIAAAEILVPGIRVPTFDAKRNIDTTRKLLCAFRRSVLDQAYEDATVSAIVRQFIGDKAGIKRLPCDTVKGCFNLAVDAVKQRNNGGAVRSSMTGDDRGAGVPVVRTIADINRANAERYKDVVYSGHR